MAVDYWYAVLRRRWPVLVLVFAVALVAITFLAVRDYRHRSWTSTAQLFVAPAPGLTDQSSSASQLLASEAYARQIARDISKVIVGRRASQHIARYLHRKGVSSISTNGVEQAIGASSSGREVTVTATASSNSDAKAIAGAEVLAGTRWRARFVGGWGSRHSAVRVIGTAQATRASAGHIALTFLVRLILGAVVAIAVALAWDYLDDSIQSTDDLERWLEAPVLARIAG